MSLPALAGWETTRDSLQVISQVLTGFRKAFTPSQPLAQHFSLYVTASGLSTGETNVGEFTLNFANNTVEYRELGGKTVWLPLAKYVDTAGLVSDLVSETAGIDDPSQIKLPPTTPLNIIPALCAEYGVVLDRIYTAVSRFRTRLMGTMTPALVWSHHFDLSFLWFKGNELDDYKPHINFGFSPASEGFPRPYLYIYAYPMPDNIMNQALPAPARWYDGAWKGVVIDYDDLLDLTNPDDKLEALLMAIYRIYAARL
ncbi:MAG TPA: DUF5996 family protein [Phototrophicaceae bacterium]|nr:DUF5996 family protein [Phototrophicaceae bacterium]